jgi:hypothetical protein
MSNPPTGKCVLCLVVKPLTEEHIFPDGIGGYLTADILCKDCNSNLGHKIDAPYLEQPHVELARNALRISGKRNHIPQPFSEIYEVTAAQTKLRIRLDVDFKPKVIPDVPDVSIQPDGGLSMSLTLDAGDRGKISDIIQKKLERFFETPTGKSLNWTPQQIKDAITLATKQASQVDADQSPVGWLQGKFQVDLNRLFLEHVKVAYEIACIHYKDHFLGTGRAEEIRRFLYENSQEDKTDTWDIGSVAKQLRITPQLADPATNLLIAQLTGNAIHAFHVALITGQHVSISMLGMGVVLTDAVDAQHASSAIFVNDIQRKKCTIQRF